MAYVVATYIVFSLGSYGVCSYGLYSGVTAASLQMPARTWLVGIRPTAWGRSVPHMTGANVSTGAKIADCDIDRGMRARARACVRACVRAYVRACVM